jgi:quercetin dioxygenase-like cupin family protein
VAAGTTFPEHEHLGEETVLVLQGAFTEPGSGRTVRAGETDVLSAQSSHTFHAPPDGPDLLMLQVTAVGVRVGEHTYLPR